VRQSLCANHCAPITVRQSLCANHCAPITVRQSLCANHCVPIIVCLPHARQPGRERLTERPSCHGCSWFSARRARRKALTNHNLPAHNMCTQTRTSIRFCARTRTNTLECAHTHSHSHTHTHAAPTQVTWHAFSRLQLPSVPIWPQEPRWRLEAAVAELKEMALEPGDEPAKPRVGCWAACSN